MLFLRKDPIINIIREQAHGGSFVPFQLSNPLKEDQK